MGLIVAAAEQPEQATLDDLDDGNDPAPPSPEQITALCAAIQAGWTPGQRRRASITRPAPWMPPVGRVLVEVVEE